MKREEFISSLGLGIALVCTGACMSACGSKGDTGTPTPNPTPNPSPSNGKVSIDISKIPNLGDQTTQNAVLFIRIGNDNTTASFVATESVCPHQGGVLVWKKDQNLIQCQLHFSEYSTNGSVIQGPQNTSGSTRNLNVYATSISGTTLTANVS